MNLDRVVTRAISQLTAPARETFAKDPHGLIAGLGLKIRAVDDLSQQREDGGTCDGMSFLQDGVILYAPTPRSRRENFTLAHELGHWLVERAPGLYDWIADQDEPGPILESICDRIAQQLLLPDTLVEAVVPKLPVGVGHFFDLYENSHASRPACAIALARRLPGLGAVALIDQMTGKVEHASVKPDPDQGWPKVFPWRGQRLMDGHALLRLEADAGFTRRIAWRTPWGTAADFYVDARSDGKRVVVIFADTDVWKVEALPSVQPREFDERPLLKTFCCGKDQWVRGYPCPTCKQPFCSVCGDCKCTKQSALEGTCTKCFTLVNRQRLVDGLCEECRS